MRTSYRVAHRATFGLAVLLMLLPAAASAPAHATPAPLSGASALAPRPPEPTPIAPREAALGGGAGSVAYSWELSNGSTSAGPLEGTDLENPAALALDDRSGILWVAWGTGPVGRPTNVSLVNAGSGAFVGNVPGTEFATGLLYDAASDRMYVAEENASTGAGTVATFNASSDEAIFPPASVGLRPGAMVLDPYAGLLWVADNGSDALTALNTSTGAVRYAELPVGSEPSGLAYDPLVGDLYVANYASGNLTVRNGSTGALVIGGISLSPEILPVGVLFDPLVHEVIVAGSTPSLYFDAGVVALVDPTVNVLVGVDWSSPTDSAASATLDPLDGEVLLPEAGNFDNYGPAEGLIGFDPTTGAFRLLSPYVGLAPTLGVVDAATGRAYFAHAGRPSYLSSVNLSDNFSAGPAVGLGAYPEGSAVDPIHGTVFVADAYAGPLGASEPDRIVPLSVAGGSGAPSLSAGTSGTGYGLGFDPMGVGYDPVANAMVVADAASNDSAAINASTGTLEGAAFPTGIAGQCQAPSDIEPIFVPCGPTEAVYDPFGAYEILADPWGSFAVLNGTTLSLVRDFREAGASGPYPYSTPELPYDSLAVDPSNGTLIYLDDTLARIYELNLQTGSNASGSLAGTLPSSVVVDPLDGDAYVSDYGRDVVDVINLTSLSPVASVPVGLGPSGLVFDPALRAVVVANTLGDNLTVLNGSTPAAASAGSYSVPVGPGPSSIALDATNDELLVSSTEFGTVEVVARVPVVSGFTIGRGVADVGVPVTVRTSAGGGTGPLTYTYTGLPPGCVSRDLPSFPCAPTAPGNFTPNVAVGDAVPGTVSASAALQVNPAPVLQVGATSRAVDGRTVVGFDGVPENGTPPFRVDWNFGDGTTGVGLATTHTFPGPGVYPVTAEVLDAVGGNATGEVVIAVGGPLGLEVAGTGNGTAATQIATFGGRVLGGLPPFDFTWTFGDGSTLTTGASGGASPNASDVGHVYASSGRYHVSLVVSDAGGETANATWNVEIGAAPPTPPPTRNPHPAGSPAPIEAQALLGLDLVAAAAVVALAIVRWRRASRRPPPPPPGAFVSPPEP